MAKSGTPSEDYSPSDTTQSQTTFSSPKSLGSIGSGSGQSATTYLERDEDFTKETEWALLVQKRKTHQHDKYSSSPLDLEATIQEERITKILDEALYKIRAAICLPQLVKDGTLKNELTNQSYDEVMLIYEQYDSHLFSNSLLNMSAVEDIRAGDFSMQNRLSPEQGHLISVINSCPSLRLIIAEMIYQMKKSKSETKITSPALEYLLVFELYRDLFVRQLKWTAAEVLQAKITTRKLEISNTKLIAKIAELSESLLKEREEFEKTLVVRAQIIANLEHDLQVQNFEASTKLRKKILDSERQMVLMTRSHIVTNEFLQEDEQNTKEMYENTLKNNIKDEKALRARRCKVETQLLSWIQKYDNDMADNQNELDDFTVKYEEEERKVAILEERLAEQDKEFVPLMAEREAEYAQEMKDKMIDFQKDHAARILQTCWRQVLDNRKEKKKLKRALKKKKEAEAKAERLAYLKFKKEQRIIAMQKKKEKAEAKKAKMRK